MRIQLQPGYILHSRDYRDSSKTLEVFTPEYGRLTLVARSARRSTRRSGSTAVLQPFVPLLLSFSGRGEMKTLTGSEAAGVPVLLRANRLYSGLYINELLVRLLHRHDPHPTLFAHYALVLQNLAVDETLEAALRHFEYQLLDELGYIFDFAHDGFSGAAVAPGQWYHYQPQYGLVQCSGVAERALPVYAGSDLLLMAAGEFSGPARQTAKRLLRQALAEHLGAAPLHSRELFRAAHERAAHERAAHEAAADDPDRFGGGENSSSVDASNSMPGREK